MPVEITLVGAEALQRRYGELGRHLPTVVARALNRAIVAARTALRAGIKAAGVQPKYAARGQDIIRATRESLVAVLRQGGRPLPLIAYLPRQGFRSGLGIAGLATATGTAVGAGRFYAATQQGHRGVFHRVGPRRLPIKQDFGPSLGQFVQERRLVTSAVEARAREVFTRRLEHEAQRLLAGQTPERD